jgi:hypothetical protein
MSHTATISISTSDARTERAFAALYREAQSGARNKRNWAARADYVLALGNAATWAYTLLSLAHQL